MNYDEISPIQLVDLLGDKQTRNDAIVGLVGGITATEMKNTSLSDDRKQALFDGLKHANANVRWWCIQLMDHLADESYVQALIDVAHNDPSPKNRRHAIHALTCEACKPDGCMLDIDLSTILRTIIQFDTDWSVKMMALEELQEYETNETVTDVINNLSGSQKIQIKSLQQTQNIQQDLHTLQAYVKQIKGWRGRAIYNICKGVDKLLQASIAILLEKDNAVIESKLNRGIDQIIQVADDSDQQLNMSTFARK